MTITQFNSCYNSIKSTILSGRYIPLERLEKFLGTIPESWVSILGRSVENRPIYGLTLGTGPKKVLLWSQMHGNESTTTKALCDLLNLVKTKNETTERLLEQCSLQIIPMLNPDGAARYTRLNANEVDLNRDAQERSQPESRVLRQVFEAFNPDYCFNLHGQRTIFGAGDSGKVATLSFLSPSRDQERSINTPRKTAMAIIHHIAVAFQDELPGQIGRYDDGFNLNCVGDTFQYLGVPTLLFEAGHFPGDYNREVVRRQVGFGILKGLDLIAHGFDISGYQGYFGIPENKKNFYDIIIRQAKLEEAQEDNVDIAIQFNEVLIDQSIRFIPVVKAITTPNTFFAHKEIHALNAVVTTSSQSRLEEGYENDFVLINSNKIALKP